MIEDFLDRWKGEIYVAFLGLVCVAVSSALLSRPGVVTGILGSFIGVSGVEILLWVCGLRLEILGSATIDTVLNDFRTMHRHPTHFDIGFERSRIPEMFEFQLEELNREVKFTELLVRLRELRDQLGDVPHESPESSGIPRQSEVK